MQDIKAIVAVPAGPRPLAGDPNGRSEIVARQDLGETSEALEAREAGIGFGLQVQAPEKIPADFDPAVIKVPFGLHAANNSLTKLRQAEREGDQDYIDEFWNHVKRWSKWSPRPLFVNYHGAVLGEIPAMDEHRFNCSIEPEDWLEGAIWHERVFARMRELGLPATLEPVYLFNYYGPGAGFEPNWLPLTHFRASVGIACDILNIVSGAGVRALVDFEHLEHTLVGLAGTTIEIRELKDTHWARVGLFPEFEAYFGFAAEKGKICRPIQDLTWEELVSSLRTPFYHIGGISSQVLKLSPEKAETEYHLAMQRQLEGNPYAQRLVRFRRGGSHDAVDRGNQRFREMLRHVLSLGIKEPLFLVCETSNYAEGKKPDEDPGYWYWALPDALTHSIREARFVLKEELG